MEDQPLLDALDVSMLLSALVAVQLGVQRGKQRVGEVVRIEVRLRATSARSRTGCCPTTTPTG
ncbi:MAG: hypothetical protein M3425_04520 [Actinomycetota bacterium]|nr:hypothetical protein [Actinomycetota bacterium]